MSSQTSNTKKKSVRATKVSTSKPGVEVALKMTTRQHKKQQKAAAPQLKAKSNNLKKDKKPRKAISVDSDPEDSKDCGEEQHPPVAAEISAVKVEAVKSKKEAVRKYNK